MTLAVPHHPRVSMNDGDQSKVDSVVSWFSLKGEEGGRGHARVPHLWLLSTLYFNAEYSVHNAYKGLGIPSLGLERFRGQSRRVG